MNISDEIVAKSGIPAIVLEEAKEELAKTNELTQKQCDELSKNIVKVLKDSIKQGGSTISDYVQSDGKKGNFQNSFLVYGRDKKACKICNTVIKKITISGRTTFYCERCQK